MLRVPLHVGERYRESHSVRRLSEFRTFMANGTRECEPATPEQVDRIRFNHDKDTKFPLRPAMQVKCDTCHTGDLYATSWRPQCLLHRAMIARTASFVFAASDVMARINGAASHP